MNRPSSARARTASGCLIAIGMVLVLGGRAWAQPAVVCGTLTTLDYPGATGTTATDINDSGTVVGLFNEAVPPAPPKLHGFVYANGTYLQLDVDGASATQAWGLNEHGDIVGFYYLPGDPLYHGFLRRSSGVYETIDRNGAMNTMPEDINDAGFVVGCIHNNGLMNGFVWKDGAFVSIDASNRMYTGVNESGTAIGYAFDMVTGGNDSFAVSGVDRVEFSYPGAANTQAWGVNQAGDIVGWYGPSTSATGFVRNHNGQFTPIAVSGATFTRPLGINEAGTIVGVYGKSGNHGFVLVP